MANPNPSVGIQTQLDLRLDIDGTNWNLNSISDETVPLTGVVDYGSTAYKIGYLAERPVELNFFGSNAAPAIDGKTLVTALSSIDGATKFYIDYERALVICHSSLATVDVTYSGIGTVIRSLDMNNKASTGKAIAMAIVFG